MDSIDASGPVAKGTARVGVTSADAAILSIPARGGSSGLETLLPVLARVDDAEGCVVLVMGLPGSGKTELADRLSRWVRGQGGTVLWTSCEAGGGGPAFWPWLRLLREYLDSRPEGSFADELRERMGEVIEMMPALDTLLQGHAVPATIEPATARFRLYDGVTRVLRRASEDDLLLLVMDDLEAADDPSLELLRHVGSELWGSRILLLGLSRPLSRRSRASLRTTVEALARVRGSRRIELEDPGLGQVRRPAPGLTARQGEVAALVVDGLSNREISERLFMSERTAANHVQNILNKLGYTNRAQIAAWVARRER